MGETLEQVQQAIKAEIKNYHDYGYEAWLADYGKFGVIKDYRKRNAGIDPAKVQFLYTPEAIHRTVFYKYDVPQKHIPWRRIGVRIAYKETAKLFNVGYDMGLDAIARIRHIEEPWDSPEFNTEGIGYDLSSPFVTISKDLLGEAVFRTAEEALGALPEEHKIPRSEMERSVAEAEAEAEARRQAEDDERRHQPCWYCKNPIGDAAYILHMYEFSTRIRHYAHFDCRTCDICGETIVGNYCSLETKKELQPMVAGPIRTIVPADPAQVLYYHEQCANKHGIQSDNGGMRSGSRYILMADHDLVTA